MAPVPAKGSRSGEKRRTPGSARLRRELVEQLERSGSLTSPAVRRAFLAVPRERFIPKVAARDGLERVYRDQAIVTVSDGRGVPASSSSQPSLMASMLEQLDLRPGQRVLEVGAGTGYNAALLARIVGSRGRIVSVELDPATARSARRHLADARSSVEVVRGDGREGWPRAAPYDRIIVTAAARSVAPAWHDQLVEGGLLELPLVVRDGSAVQAILTLRKEGQALRSVALLPGGFMPLRDAPGGPVPPPAPSLGAHEHVGRPRALIHLSGEALGRLSSARRQALLALALSKPRSRDLGLRADRSALGLYLTIEAPAGRLVAGWDRIGVISEGGAGLALLGGGAKRVTRIECYGERAAERLLLELIEGWKRRGRPGVRDLRLEMSSPTTRHSGFALSWEAIPRPMG